MLSFFGRFWFRSNIEVQETIQAMFKVDIQMEDPMISLIWNFEAIWTIWMIDIFPLIASRHSYINAGRGIEGFFKPIFKKNVDWVD